METREQPLTQGQHLLIRVTVAPSIWGAWLNSFFWRAWHWRFSIASIEILSSVTLEKNNWNPTENQYCVLGSTGGFYDWSVYNSLGSVMTAISGREQIYFLNQTLFLSGCKIYTFQLNGKMRRTVKMKARRGLSHFAAWETTKKTSLLVESPKSKKEVKGKSGEGCQASGRPQTSKGPVESVVIHQPVSF